jgi:beta-lactam-binding protein with PASTA domain
VISLSDTIPTQRVPNVVHSQPSAAASQLAAAGLVAVFVAKNQTVTHAPAGAVVVAQMPAPGFLAALGADIALYLD